eukprot:jgi/Picsp_1/3131/NSC_05972-R1_g patch domain-containing protein 1
MQGTDRDQEDYHFFGTAIEEEVSGNRYRKRVQNPSTTRTLPEWKQEVTDELGRKRFHGAFTGGFSAGYYNSVGSAEGWKPSEFKSSRSNRSKVESQSVEQFLDEDELQEYQATKLAPSMEYDTFGVKAKSLTESHAEKEVGGDKNGSGVPSLVPEILVTPVSEGVGVRLLLKMGWRRGKGLALRDEEEVKRLMEQAKTTTDIEHLQKNLRVENTMAEVPRAKNNVFGLGFDPYAGAEEFRRMKHDESKSNNRFSEKRRSRGVAFGTSVLDEDDAIGMLEDYVSHEDLELTSGQGGIDLKGLPMSKYKAIDKKVLGDRLALQGYSFEVQDASDEEEEKLGGRKEPLSLLEGRAAMEMLSHPSVEPKFGTLPGFLMASSSTHDVIHAKQYPGPKLNRNYEPRTPRILHETKSRNKHLRFLDLGKQPTPPTDVSLKQTIDQVALQVARSGPGIEVIAREHLGNSKGNSKYEFLDESSQYHNYYVWRVEKFNSLLSPNQDKRSKFTAEQRRSILGEESLQRVIDSGSKLQTQREEASREKKLALALQNIPEKDRKRFQERMASTFVKSNEKVLESSQGGLRLAASKPRPKPEEGDKKSRVARKIVTVFDLSKPLQESSVVASSAVEDAKKAASQGIPVRSIEEWVPEPLLCKRLGVEDPFLSRAPQRSSARPELKTDSIVLSVNDSRVSEDIRNQEQIGKSQEFVEPAEAKTAANAFLASLTQTEPEQHIVQGEKRADFEALKAASLPSKKPVDLFQAIFENSSSDEEDVQEDLTTKPQDAKDTVSHESYETKKDEIQDAGLDFGFSKFKTKAGDKHSTEKRERRSSPPVDDAQVQEAIRVLKEAKKRERRSRHRSRSREHRSKQRHRSRGRDSSR